MGIGIRNIFRLAADQSVASSTALVDVTGLTAPIAVNQKMKFRLKIYITEAAGVAGIKFQIITPAATTHFVAALSIWNAVAAHLAIDNLVVQTASSAVTGTLGNAGNDYAEIEGEVVNGANAGVVKLQFAQAVSDAGATTLLQGTTMEIVYE
jgi:hypothetical protein